MYPGAKRSSPKTARQARASAAANSKIHQKPCVNSRWPKKKMSRNKKTLMGMANKSI